MDFFCSLFHGMLLFLMSFKGSFLLKNHERFHRKKLVAQQTIKAVCFELVLFAF